jgi:hypothetical protein
VECLKNSSPRSNETLEVPVLQPLHLQSANNLSDSDSEEVSDRDFVDPESSSDTAEDPHESFRIHNPRIGLPTPAPAAETPSPEPGTCRTKRCPPKEIRGDVDESNIIQGPRTRKPSARKEAYLTDVTRAPTELTGFHTAFSAALTQPKEPEGVKIIVLQERLTPAATNLEKDDETPS